MSGRFCAIFAKHTYWIKGIVEKLGGDAANFWTCPYWGDVNRGFDLLQLVSEKC